MAEITDAAIREVYECHVLIQNWFAGHRDPTPRSLEPVLSKFASNFSMINPGGAVLGKPDLDAFLRNMHGARPGVIGWDDSQCRCPP